MAEVSIEELAKSGDTEAQCSLAFLFEVGLDRPQDYRQCALYWQMAAKAGRQLALDKLQQLLNDGKIQQAWLESTPAEMAKNRPSRTRTVTQLGIKILMADDDEEIRSLMAQALGAVGFQIIHASNGEEAIQKILATPDIKLIITDLKMPKLNGLQMVKNLRRMQVAETAKIIVMTAFSQPNLIAEGKKLNVDAWLVKPVRQETLIDTIKRLLERKPQVA